VDSDPKNITKEPGKKEFQFLKNLCELCVLSGE
jgi:hypothetical protein